jgi:hypothetical protein
MRCDIDMLRILLHNYLQTADILLVMEDNKQAWHEFAAAAVVTMQGGNMHLPTEHMSSLHHPHRLLVSGNPLHALNPEPADVLLDAGGKLRIAFVSQLMRALSPRKKSVQ